MEKSKYYVPSKNTTGMRYKTYYYPFFFYPDFYFADYMVDEHDYEYIPETHYKYKSDGEYQYVEGFGANKNYTLFFMILVIFAIFLIYLYNERK
jgi:hypothetical protein